MSRKGAHVDDVELAPQIEAIVLMDNSGHRLCAKYYATSLDEFKCTEAQAKFEGAILTKTNRMAQRSDTDILLYAGHLVLFKTCANVKIFLVAASTANELIMDEVITGFEEALTVLLRGTIDSRSVIDNMDFVLLGIDELCEEGIIFETSGDTIAKRVLMRDIVHGDVQETVSEVWEKAKEQFFRSH